MTAPLLHRDTIAERVRAFVADGFVLDPGAALADDTPLLQGRIDSVGLMELVTFVEDEFGVELAYEDIDEEHLGTIGRIAALVEERSTSP